MARRKQYTFIKKKSAPNAKLSILFTTISLVIMLVLFLVSLGFGGQGGMVLGAAGLAAMLLAFYAFILGLGVLRKRNPEYRLPAFCTLYSGVISLGWVALAIWGLH